MMIYLFVALIYTHLKAWVTEPGYPERVATATGQNKMNFDKNDLNLINSFKQTRSGEIK